MISHPGDYFVSGTNSLGCVAVSDTAHLAVYSVAVSSKGDTLFVPKQYIRYQWYLNNVPVAGDTSASIIALQPGSYTVQATDTNGCIAVSGSHVITGLNSISADDNIMVYPNPTTNGTWQVEVGVALVGSVCEVFDAQGKRVYSGYLTSTKNTVFVKVSSGMYVMKISSVSGVYNVKLVQF